MSRPLSLTLVLLAAPALMSACLEARRAGGVTDTVATDTVATDTSTADTTTADTTTTDRCLGVVCDDGDPCTRDSCDPLTGECSSVVVSAAEPPECDDDIDCDDGDPCTVGRCRFADDSQVCGGWRYCEQVLIPGACGCQVVGCDDGDPCTRDFCEPDGACRYVDEPHCVSECHSKNALSPSDARWIPWPGDAVKVAGTAVPTGDGLYCEACTCTADLGISDATSALTLLPPQDVSSSWSCSVEQCGGGGIMPAVDCQPLHNDVAYWVWGVASDAWTPLSGAEWPWSEGEGGEEDGAGAPRPEIDRVRVEDFCLQTTPAGLVGRYRGHYRPLQADLEVPVTATISVTANGSTVIAFEPGACPGCPSWFRPAVPNTVELTLGDGFVTFDAVAPGACDWNTAPASFRLYSRRNQLVGDYVDEWMVDGGFFDGDEGPPREDPGQQEDVAWCSVGTLTLTREP